MYWVKCNGICVLTEAGKPAFVLVDPRRYAALSERVGAIVAVAAARARNPGGLFTLADEVFGTHVLADWWMAQENGSLAGMRPVEKLSTEQGLEEVLDVLRRIQHGMFA